MKRLILFLFLVCLSSTLSGQQQKVDSIKKILPSADDDQTRLRCISDLFQLYIWSQPDSAVPYARQYMTLALKMKSDSKLAWAYVLYQQLAQLTGNYPQALEYAFKALTIAERSKDFLIIGDTYRVISDTYLAQGDIKRAILYAQKSKALIEANYSLPPQQLTQRNDTLYSYAANVYTLCKAYEKAGDLDSVLTHIKLVEWVYAWSWKETGVRYPTIPFTYGNIYFKKEDYFEASRYYHEGVVSSIHWGINKDLMDNLNGLAQTFKMLNQWDSVIHYGGNVLKISQMAQYPIVKMEALTLLAVAFKAKNNVDSSAKYFELALTTKDSLFNQSKIVQMQNFTFNEQLRQQEMEEAERQQIYRYRLYALILGLTVVILISVLLYRNIRVKQKAKVKIEKAYNELRTTQSQLIQSEKMASLGELTAGIAHEIQNPLNFVNNFSEVNTELINELKNEIDIGNFQEVKSIAKDLEKNMEKISHHGKRADAIVKGMLQHSRISTGQKEPTDINALTDEFLRLSYHGLRAKDKAFNATLITELDVNLSADKAGINKIAVVPQDIGRVLLNLFNNAFFSVMEKKKSAYAKASADKEYEPTISVSTKKLKDKVEIKVRDNGMGIPQNVLDKIYQPFFTTKPAGQGTGLGLSLAYDIVKAHGGELKVETKEGEFAEFIILLPDN